MDSNPGSLNTKEHSQPACCIAIQKKSLKASIYTVQCSKKTRATNPERLAVSTKNKGYWHVILVMHLMHDRGNTGTQACVSGRF